MAVQVAVDAWLKDKEKYFIKIGLDVVSRHYDDDDVVAVLEFSSKEVLAEFHVFRDCTVALYGGLTQRSLDFVPISKKCASLQDTLDLLLKDIVSFVTSGAPEEP